MVNPCNIVDALADFQYTLIAKINKKFEQLRRLAALLEQLGDLSALAPNLSALIPVVNIDFNAYQQIAASCPFLGLSTNPVDGDLNSLRQQVLAAYDSYARQILNHPYSRLGKLQEEMDAFQSKIADAMGVGSGYLQCLQAMCAAGSQLASNVSKLSSSTTNATLSKYTNEYLKNAGSVLSEPAKIKYQQSVDALAQMRELGVTGVGKDYRSLSSSYRNVAAAATTTQPVAASSSWQYPPYAP